MANITINNGGVVTNSTNIPNIDLRYGPYDSLELANEALIDTKTSGLTVGIKQVGGGIKDYWYQPNLQTGLLELVQKQLGGDVYYEDDYNNLNNKPSINGHVLSGNKLSKDLGLVNQIQLNDGTQIFPDEEGNIKLPIIPQATNTISPESNAVPTSSAVNTALNSKQDNITSLDNVYPVVSALVDRSANIDETTEDVKSLGYKVLNPELSFSAQVESTETVNNSNTIFEIRDEFDLNGGTVNIPPNCTLKFNGGLIVNGNLIGNNTKIDAPEDRKIFGLNVNIGDDNDSSTWAINYIPVDWFGAVGDGSTNDTGAINKALKTALSKKKVCTFSKRTYLCKPIKRVLSIWDTISSSVVKKNIYCVSLLTNASDFTIKGVEGTTVLIDTSDLIPENENESVVQSFFLYLSIYLRVNIYDITFQGTTKSGTVSITPGTTPLSEAAEMCKNYASIIGLDTIGGGQKLGLYNVKVKRAYHVVDLGYFKTYRREIGQSDSYLNANGDTNILDNCDISKVARVFYIDDLSQAVANTIQACRFGDVYDGVVNSGSFNYWTVTGCSITIPSPFLVHNNTNNSKTPSNKVSFLGCKWEWNHESSGWNTLSEAGIIKMNQNSPGVDIVLNGCGVGGGGGYDVSFTGMTLSGNCHITFVGGYYNGKIKIYPANGNMQVYNSNDGGYPTISFVNVGDPSPISKFEHLGDVVADTYKVIYNNSRGVNKTYQLGVGGPRVIPNEDITVDARTLNNRDTVIDSSTGEVSSLGYKILKAPDPGDSTTEIQEQLSPTTEGTSVPIPNTIFEIRDCFDLNNTTLTIPENCTLSFNGGKIINGTIKGNKTQINAPSYQIFENISFSGSFIGSLNAFWIGAKSSISTTTFDNSPIIQSWFGATSSSGYCKVWKKLEFPTGSYYFFSPINSNPDNSSVNRHLELECNNSIFRTIIPTDSDGNGQSFLTIQLEEFSLKNLRIYNNSYDKTIAIKFSNAQRFSVENIEVWYFDIAYYFNCVWYGSFSGKQTLRGNRVGIYTFRDSTSGNGEINTVDFHNISIGSPAARSNVNSAFRDIYEPFNLNLSEQLILDDITYNISDSTLTITSGNQIIIPANYCLVKENKSSLVTDISTSQTKYSVAGTYYIASVNNSGNIAINYEESDSSLETRVPICGFDIHTPINTCKFYGCTIEGVEYGIKESWGSYNGSQTYRTHDDIEIIDSCYFEANKKYNIYIGNGYWSKDYNKKKSYSYSILITRYINITNCRFFSNISSSFSLASVTWTSNQPANLYFPSTYSEGHNELIDDGKGVCLLQAVSLFRNKLGRGNESIYNVSNNSSTTVFSTNRHSLDYLDKSATSGIPINSLSSSDSNGGYKEFPYVKTLSTVPKLSYQDTIRAGEIQRTLYRVPGDNTTYSNTFTFIDTISGVQKKLVYNSSTLFNQISFGTSTDYSDSERSISIPEFFDKWDSGVSYIGYVEKLWAFKIYANPSVGFVYKYDETKHPNYSQSNVVGFGNTALADSNNYKNNNLFDESNSSSSIHNVYAIYLDGMIYFYKGKLNVGGWQGINANLCDLVLNSITNSEISLTPSSTERDSEGYWIARYRKRLTPGTESSENLVYRYLNNIMYSRTSGKTLIYDGYNWVELTDRFARYRYRENGDSISLRMTAGISPESTYYNYATGILYRFKVNKNSATCGTWISSIGNVDSLEHPNGYDASTNPLSYATELSKNEAVMCNGRLYVWDGQIWRDSSGNYLDIIQVSNKEVQLESTSNSSNTIDVYTTEAPNITAKNTDNTLADWLNYDLVGTTLTITAISDNTTENPREGKIILTNSNSEVIINVVQTNA